MTAKDRVKPAIQTITSMATSLVIEGYLSLSDLALLVAGQDAGLSAELGDAESSSLAVSLEPLEGGIWGSSTSAQRAASSGDTTCCIVMYTCRQRLHWWALHTRPHFSIGWRHAAGHGLGRLDPSKPHDGQRTPNGPRRHSRRRCRPGTTR